MGGKILCPKCLKRKCQDCSLLNYKYSQEEKDVFQRMWNNIVLIKDSNGNYKVKVNYLYKSDPNIIFSPENTNYNQALMMTKKVIQQLKKKGQLEMFQKEIEKKINIVTLVAMSESEVKETMKSTHHFTLLAMVMSETSTSTSARLINNTKTQVPGQGTSYCLENEMIKCN